MSNSGSPRGGKGGSTEKKTKRAKGEFHSRKKLVSTSTETSKEEIRKRVLDSLEHLGHQRLSNEPGGYDLQSWLKSLRRLLDDFEEKAGSESVTQELRTKRAEVEADFSRLGDSSELDSEIEKARSEEMEIKMKLKEEAERIASRLSVIGGEKTSKGLELKEGREELEKLEEERRSVSRFSRLMGKSGPPTEPAEKKVKDLEEGLKMLEKETLSLKAARRALDGGKEAAAGAYADLFRRLDELDERVDGLDAARETRKQLLEERERATENLKKIVSSLSLREDDDP